LPHLKLLALFQFSQQLLLITLRQDGYTKIGVDCLTANTEQDGPVRYVSTGTISIAEHQLTALSTAQHPDDVVITLAIRTPLAKGKKGGFKDTELDFIVYSLLKKVLEKSKIDPAVVEDVCLGNVRSQSRCLL